MSPMLCDGVGVLPLVSDPRGIHESPRNIGISNELLNGWRLNDNQRRCDHGQWPEANVGQHDRKGPDRLVVIPMMLTSPVTINPEK